MKSMTGHLRQQVSRLITVALLLALAISFVACGGQEEPKKSGQFKMNQANGTARATRKRAPAMRTFCRAISTGLGRLARSVRANAVTLGSDN